MPTRLQKANNALTTLAEALAADGDTISLQDISRFPVTYPFHLTVWQASDGRPDPDDPTLEILRVIASVGNGRFTIVRGYENTAPVAHERGDNVGLLMTVAHFDELEAELDIAEQHQQSDGTDHTYIDQDLQTSAAPTFAGLAQVGDAVNKFTVAADGELALAGTARVHRHHYVHAEMFKKVVGGSPPGDSLEGMFGTLDFDDAAMEQVYATLNIPYRWAVGTDIEAHAVWLIDANAADAGKFVRWGIEYRAVAIGEAVAGATVSITEDQAGLNNIQGKRIDTVFGTKILGTNLATHDQLGLRAYRDATNDDYPDDARLIGLHVIFTMDKLGKAT